MTAALCTTPAPTTITGEATRRQFIALMGAAGLLTACGTSSTPADATGTREITDPTGRQVTVPRRAERVVVLDPNRVIAEVVSLGLVPVGATTNDVNDGGGFSPLLADVASRITPVGTVGAADVEQVAALRPDLILFAAAYEELAVRTLSDIAPVVAYDFAGGLVEPVRWLGEALGRQEEAAEVERDFQELLAARAAEFQLAGRKVAVVNLGYEVAGTVYVFGPDQALSQVVDRFGADLVTVDGGEGDGFGTDVSLELIGPALAEADLVIGLRYGGGGAADEAYAAVTGSPLWNQVPAIASGAIAYLDVQEANANYGLPGVAAALDSLAEQLR